MSTILDRLRDLVIKLWRTGFIKFAGSSFLCWSTDQLIAAALADWLLPLAGITEIASRAWISGCIARVLSASINFLINRKAVFSPTDRSFVRTAVKYAVLATAIISCSNTGVTLLTEAGLPRWIAKIGCDFVLYFANFTGQRFWVFRRRPDSCRTD